MASAALHQFLNDLGLVTRHESEEIYLLDTDLFLSCSAQEVGLFLDRLWVGAHSCYPVRSWLWADPALFPELTACLRRHRCTANSCGYSPTGAFCCRCPRGLLEDS